MKTIPILSLLACLLALPVSAQNADPLDAYGGFTDISGEKTGFFHSEKIDGRWWLVTPDGHGFFGIGLSHPVTSFSEGAVNFSYAGDQEKWLRDGIAKMRAMGYNCVWSGPYSSERIHHGFVDTALAERVYREEKIPHAIQVPLINHASEQKPGEKWVDVFSDDYAELVREMVAKHVTPNRDNPWVLGYYFGFGSFMRNGILINDTLERPAGSPGRERLFDVLEKRYGDDFDALNEIYGTEHSSWASVRRDGGIAYPTRMFLRNKNERRAADQDALLAEIVERVHQLAHTEIRKLDKHHMIFGCYVKGSTYPPEIWQRITPFIDVLAPQHFSPTNKIKPVSEQTGLPVLLSDQVFGNVYPEALLGSNRTPSPVPGHLDRRVLYHLLSRRIAADSDFIGVSFCACLHDNSHCFQPYDRGQPGFYTVDNEPRGKTIATATEANAFIYKSLRKPLGPAGIRKLDEDYHRTVEFYKGIALKRKQLLQQK